jgi:hypothetical protein
MSDEKNSNQQRKYYVFRPSGQDEGFIVRLTDEENLKIQKRLDEIEGGQYTSSDPFYLYEMDFATFKDINKILDEFIEAEKQ